MVEPIHAPFTWPLRFKAPSAVGWRRSPAAPCTWPSPLPARRRRATCLRSLRLEPPPVV